MADTDILGKNEVTIKWNEISKAKRNGIITSYTIFYKSEDGKELSKYTLNSNTFNRVMKFLIALPSSHTFEANGKSHDRSRGAKIYKRVIDSV